jgi:hypothetical protein
MAAMSPVSLKAIALAEGGGVDGGTSPSTFVRSLHGSGRRPGSNRAVVNDGACSSKLSDV